MQTKLQKWGNSLAIRIPMTFVKEAHVAYGTTVDLSVENGRIVIEPIAETAFRLDDLLNGITDDNIHTEVDTGSPAGKEAW